MAYQAIPPVATSQDGVAAAWAARVAAFVATKDATINKFTWVASCQSMNEFDRGAATNSGTVEMIPISGSTSLKLRCASGTTANSLRIARNRNYTQSGATGTFNNLCTNVRTSHWAMAARVIVQAVTATCEIHGIDMSDEATQACYMGVLGATSTANFVLKIGSAAAIDTSVAIGTLGAIEHDLIMMCDGTTVSAYLDFATTAAASGASNTAANAAGHYNAYGGNGGTAANASIDILYAVSMGA